MYSFLATVAVSRRMMLEQTRHVYLATVEVSRSVMLEETRHV